MTGQELKTKIEVTGISMKEIAERMEISPQSLSQFFQSSDVKSSTIEKVAKALDVDPRVLYEDDIEKIRIIVRGNKNLTSVYGDNTIGHNASLEMELEFLKRENADLRSQIEDKNEIITLLRRTK